jgi:hypothetical protein
MKTTNNQQPTTNNQQPTTNNQQPTTNNPLYQAAVLAKLRQGDTFCFSGFGLKNRIMYTKGETKIRLTKTMEEVEVCRCSYLSENKRHLIVTKQKTFATSEVVLLMRKAIDD